MRRAKTGEVGMVNPPIAEARKPRKVEQKKQSQTERELEELTNLYFDLLKKYPDVPHEDLDMIQVVDQMPQDDFDVQDWYKQNEILQREIDLEHKKEEQTLLNQNLTEVLSDIYNVKARLEGKSEDLPEKFSQDLSELEFLVRNENDLEFALEQAQKTLNELRKFEADGEILDKVIEEIHLKMKYAEDFGIELSPSQKNEYLGMLAEVSKLTQDASRKKAITEAKKLLKLVNEFYTENEPTNNANPLSETAIKKPKFIKNNERRTVEEIPDFENLEENTEAKVELQKLKTEINALKKDKVNKETVLDFIDQIDESEERGDIELAVGQAEELKQYLEKNQEKTGILSVRRMTQKEVAHNRKIREKKSVAPSKDEFEEVDDDMIKEVPTPPSIPKTKGVKHKDAMQTRSTILSDTMAHDISQYNKRTKGGIEEITDDPVEQIWFKKGVNDSSKNERAWDNTSVDAKVRKPEHQKQGFFKRLFSRENRQAKQEAAEKQKQEKILREISQMPLDLIFENMRNLGVDLDQNGKMTKEELQKATVLLREKSPRGEMFKALYNRAMELRTEQKKAVNATFEFIKNGSIDEIITYIEENYPVKLYKTGSKRGLLKDGGSERKLKEILLGQDEAYKHILTAALNKLERINLDTDADRRRRKTTISELAKRAEEKLQK